MEEPWKQVTDKLSAWGTAALEMLPNIVLAILVLIAFAILARLLTRAARRPLQRVSRHRELHDIALGALKIGIMTGGVAIALGVLDLKGTVTSLLAGVGVVGLALGFAFQDIAANFMSGIILAIREPFEVGDVVEIEDFLGTIERIDLRATVGQTFTGQIVTMPNKDVIGSHIVNYSTTGQWRIEVDVGVSYGDDLDVAEEAIRGALEKVTERDQAQEVDVWFTGFGASSVDLSARVWIRLPEQSFLLCRSQMVKHIKAAVDEHGLTIPFPIRTLDFGIVGGKELGPALEPTVERLTANAA